VKLLEIFRFELAYQIRQPWPWLILAVLLGLSFVMARDFSLADALYEDFFANSSFAVTKSTVFGGLIWLLVAAVIAGEAGARDVSTGMHPLLYTTPLGKAAYLGGRFAAALVLNASLLLAVQIGILLGIYSPGVDPEVIGPFRPAVFLTAYGFIALPNAFATTAIQFTLAARVGRPMAGYAGSLLLFFTAFFVASLVLFRRELGTLLDPIGVRFIWEDLSHSWTTIEKSHRVLALQGTLLQNRLLWLVVGLSALIVTYVSFRFEHRAAGGWRWWWTRRRVADAAPMPVGLGVPATPISVPRVPRAFGLAIHVRKTFAIAWTSFRTIAKSWAGLAMLAGIPMFSAVIVLDQMGSLGTPLVPTTARVLAELTGPLAHDLSRWLIVPLLIIFFAGELVWREREARVHEITDAMPGSEWVPFLGKFLGLAFVLVAFMALLMGAGMLAQVINGYRSFEIELYLKVLFGLQLVDYLLFAVLAFAVHVWVNQKYIGHLVAVIVYVFIAALAGLVGIEHNLLVYGAGPPWSYTEMRGFGPFLGPWLWFKLYWAAWALLLAVATRLLWVSGTERGFGARLQVARHRLTRGTAVTAVLALSLIVVLGGFIFYNTNVLNDYRSSSDVERRSAEYERRYGRYENAPQPRLTRAALRVDIHPARRVVEIRGSYRLVNAGTVAIDSIHVATSMGGIATRALTFDRKATLALDDDEHGHRIYVLAQPLLAGDRLRLDFDVHREQRGFGNRGIDPAVVGRGSYFTNAWFPKIGYQRFRALMSPAQRRKHGLEPRPLLASLAGDEGREVGARGGGIAFEAVVGTDEGQVAVAPGALRRTWSQGGRRYFHYSTDAPIGDEWAFFSANYAVHEARWKDVAITFFHHPAHTGHLDGMVRSVRASLDYYTEQFGPYAYRHLTIVENPAAPGTGMHADAAMISHGQGVPHWRPTPGRWSFDMPFAVMAHEMGHQWTLPYAFVEGLPFLSEGLAWYFGIQAVRASRGEGELRRLLAFMRLPYPHRPIRRGEPLLRALDPYLSYRKGPFAMYALSQYMGAERVNGALRRLYEKHDAAAAPRVTTLDLYRELQAVAPDSLRPLLRDLFEVNTFWQLDVERARAKPSGDSTWQVTLEMRARKMVYDSAGVETELPMNEPVEIGVFADGEPGDELAKPLYLQKHRIRSGSQTITVEVSGRPISAGIDPYHMLDWEEREDDNNVEAVTIENEESTSRPK
jgi:ABC-type transport system involved in multi-copper enzyme maturation permease subunit